MKTNEQMKIRLPLDLKAFVAGQADRNRSTQNSEVVRAVRERMERTKETASESAATLAKA
ncbi:DNA-binding protein [Methylobacterium soli]|uniref:DNA-binding protein n=1 Tax=Methylobacterium soli TaxID=553447 RepID=A0A6L3T6H1_9HYPH|nr:DNA-binding protein [Methylobacterium soli]KAB1081725.1 DNA-binding protein [Methylobacterium soli]GJE46185.1 hypothetical protein AEGHOMDF_5385 [Methylobacterium soli]